jgi:hypothetical protein
MTHRPLAPVPEVFYRGRTRTARSTPPGPERLIYCGDQEPMHPLTIQTRVTQAQSTLRPGETISIGDAVRRVLARLVVG